MEVFKKVMIIMVTMVSDRCLILMIMIPCFIHRPLQPLRNLIQLQSSVIVVNVLVIVIVHTALGSVLLLGQQSTSC